MSDATATGQQHPLKTLLRDLGILLFVLSGASYATDFLDHGYCSVGAHPAVHDPEGGLHHRDLHAHERGSGWR